MQLQSHNRPRHMNSNNSSDDTQKMDWGEKMWMCLEKISWDLEEEEKLGMQMECWELYQNELCTYTWNCVLAA